MGSLNAPLNHLDVFAGILGFSLGLERSRLAETVAAIEINPFCQKVIRKHKPNIKLYSDIKDVTAERLRADGITDIGIITGGFPCQDISIAGKDSRPKGITGERSGLWSEYLRLIEEFNPDFALIENVGNLLSGKDLDNEADVITQQSWMGRILGDLSSIGFDAEWHNLRASTFAGALHSRDRVYIIAYPKGVGQQHTINAKSCFFYEWYRRQEKVSVTRGVACDKERFYEEVRTSEFIRTSNGLPDRLDRVAATGNAILPQIPELIGRAILEYEQSL